MKTRRLSLAAATLVMLPAEAAAEDAPPSASPPIEVAESDYEGVHWNERWARIHVAEYVVAPAALAGAFVLNLVPEPNLESNWRGGILFDDAFLDAAFVDDPSTFQTWQTIGDVGFYGSFALAAEPIIAAFAHSPDVGWQVAWMSLEAYSVFSSALYVSQFVVRRERPTDTMFCDDAARAAGTELADYDTKCGSEKATKAFIGGHVGAVATATALTCIHHAYLPLYGGGVADAIPCGAGIVATGLTFTARSVAGRHYLTDNLLGLSLGAISGALVPWALHYGRDARPDTGASTDDAGAARILGPAIIPAEYGDGLQVGLVGISP